MGHVQEKTYLLPDNVKQWVKWLDNRYENPYERYKLAEEKKGISQRVVIVVEE